MVYKSKGKGTIIKQCGTKRMGGTYFFDVAVRKTGRGILVIRRATPRESVARGKKGERDRSNSHNLTFYEWGFGLQKKGVIQPLKNLLWVKFRGTTDSILDFLERKRLRRGVREAA